MSVIGTPLVNEDIVQRNPVCSPSLKPTIAMNFKTLDEGILFYEKYAQIGGFVTRRSSGTLGRDKGKCISHKLVVCNKAGGSFPNGKQRRRQLTRVNCGAFISFKRQLDGSYSRFRFIESHNHLLQTPSTMKHLTQSREMNILHKKMKQY